MDPLGHANSREQTCGVPVSVIPLNKIRNYLPQHARAQRLFPQPTDTRLSPEAAAASCLASIRGSHEQHWVTDPMLANRSSYLDNHYGRQETRVSRQLLSLPTASTANSSNCFTPTPQIHTTSVGAVANNRDHQAAKYTKVATSNEVVAAAQQEEKLNKANRTRHSTSVTGAITNPSPRSSGRSKLSNSSEQASCSSGGSAISSSVRSRKGVELPSDQLLSASRGEQKRKRIGVAELADNKEGQKTPDKRSGKGEGGGGEQEQQQHQQHIADQTRNNNMTPSSLSLLQNHNYIEEQEQQQTANTTINYSTDCSNLQEVGIDGSDGRGGGGGGGGGANGDAGSGIEQMRASGTVNKQTSDDSLHLQQQHCSESASSSSQMTNINQFKALDSIGNSSIDGNANLTDASTSSTSIVDSSDYMSNQDLNHTIHHHLTGVDVLATSSSFHQQQNYQPGLAAAAAAAAVATSDDFKQANTGGGHFASYSAQNSRLSATHNYHTNFQSTMFDHPVKRENPINNRHMLEENHHSLIVNHNNNNIASSNANTDSINVARDYARQQAARSSINQYYSNHYNLMPTPSSKSTSPISSTSTPSPKTNAMHSSTSQHHNQLLSNVATSITSNPTSQTHPFDHLNQHYMTSGTTTSSLGSHQTQNVNHYSAYNQQATGGGHNQYHIAMQGHEQTYVHQHQHQQLQSQSQPQPQPQLHQQQHHQLGQPQQQQQHQQQSHQQLSANQQQQQQHHQSIYHQLANKAATVNHMYGSTGNGAHYQTHLQSSVGGNQHQSGHLMNGAHQNHIDTAAAACAAAAVVSQTLKTVANQQNQQHHYGNSLSNGFSSTTGNLMTMTAQHQQFHNVNSLNHHHQHLAGQNSTSQHQNLPAHHAASIVTRKYQCKMCPQVFMSKAEMKYHNQNHMREAKPYKCLQCPKAFANSSYLSQHMRIHQGVKPYTCDICARKFTQLSHLQQHKRTHTGDKPYKCNYMNCTKQFSQLSNLQSHSRCHQLDKPYKCNSCYKCFHDEQSLLEHIPRHLESKHLKKNLCIFCGSSYQQERGLVKHLATFHVEKDPATIASALAAGTSRANQ